jgi:hypothetical protein
MSISAKDISKLEQAMQAGDSRRLCPQRYQVGATYTGVYKILELWPDRLEEVESTDGEWRENAITYLEVDPLYFRSGYDKAQLLRHLKRAELSGDHKRRLRKVALTAVEKARSVEFRQYCQLAVRLASKDLAVGLAKLVGSPDTLISRRAAWMLEYVDKGMKEPGKSAKG